MKNKILISLVISLLAACGDMGPPDPSQCREADVHVYDDDVITGTIVESIRVTEMEEVRRLCMRPFAPEVYGCTIALGTAQYRIVWMPVKFGLGWHETAEVHEKCHALYEEWRHVHLRH